MAFNITYVFQAIDRFSTVADRIENKVRKITKRMKEWRKAVKRTRESLEKMQDGLQRTIAGLSIGFIAPMGLAIKKSIAMSAEFELLRNKFTLLMKSKPLADAFTKSLIRFTDKSPLLIRQTEEAASTLLGVGIAAKKVIPLMKELGDVASATDPGEITEYTRVAAQVVARGRVQMQQILPLLTQGIPILQTMAKVLHVNQTQLLNLMNQGKVTGKVFFAALKKLTIGNGIYAGAMKKLGNTLVGLKSTVTDNIETLEGHVGDFIVQTFHIKRALRNTITFLQHLNRTWEEFIKRHRTAGKIIIYVVIGLTSLVAILGVVAVAIGVVAGVTMLLDLVLSPIVLIILAVAAAVGILIYLFYKFRAVRIIMTVIFRVLAFLGLILASILKVVWTAFRELASIIETIFVGAFKAAIFILQAIVRGFKDFIHAIERIPIIGKLVTAFIKGLKMDIEYLVKGFLKFIHGIEKAYHALRRFVGLESKTKSMKAPKLVGIDDAVKGVLHPTISPNLLGAGDKSPVPHAFGMGGSLSKPTQNKVDITIKDKGKNVDKVEHTKEKSDSIDVGINMAHAGL